MFKELRRKDRTMEEARTLELLEKGEYGIMSMVGTNDYGYGVPLNYVLYNNAIYFHCAVEGSKIENINSNNKVSFCVVGKSEPVPNLFTTAFESVIIFGKAVEVFEKEKEEAFVALIDKFCHDFMEEGKKQMYHAFAMTKIIKIEIENVCGKIRKV